MGLAIFADAVKTIADRHGVSNGEAKPRDAFSDGEWERKLGPRYCRECLVSADLRRRLVAFQRHNPAMRRYQIDAIMREWGHNETELWRQMAIKYGQRAVDAAPPAHKIV